MWKRFWKRGNQPSLELEVKQCKGDCLRVVVIENDDDMAAIHSDVIHHLPSTAEVVCRIRNGDQLHCFFNMADARNKYDVLISDLRIPYISEEDLMAILIEKSSGKPVILVTSVSSEEVVEIQKSVQKSRPIFQYLQKPFFVSDLEEKLKSVATIKILG